MTFLQQKRWQTICLMLFSALGFFLFIYFALKENMMFFVTPTELQEKDSSKRYRLGGMVQVGSLKKNPENLSMTFIVTDFETTQKVFFQGIPPDLFREGQGVVAEGALQNGLFIATTILAKHDENYMPPSLNLETKRN